MKNSYLPDAKNDRIFAFLGDPNWIFVFAFIIIFVMLIVLIIHIARKKRKGDK